MMNVGIAATLFSVAMARWLSTSTLTNAMRPGFAYLVASDSNMGAIVLHGPHQSA
jgi:hypothetical protein